MHIQFWTMKVDFLLLRFENTARMAIKNYYCVMRVKSILNVESKIVVN